MIRKDNNRKLQTNPWQRKEEPHSNHETPGRQTYPSNQLSLPIKDDCKTRMDIKQRTTKRRTNTYSYNGSNNKQRINNNRTTALRQQPKPRGGGLNACYWYQIFDLDSAVVEVQGMLARKYLLYIGMFHLYVRMCHLYIRMCHLYLRSYCITI